MVEQLMFLIFIYRAGHIRLISEFILYATKNTNDTVYTGSFTTRALEKKRKQEIAFGSVILKKKKSNLKDIREKTT
jgi:hypothetical protein